MRLTPVADKVRSVQCVVLSTNRKYWASIEVLEDSAAHGGQNGAVFLSMGAWGCWRTARHTANGANEAFLTIQYSVVCFWRGAGL